MAKTAMDLVAEARARIKEINADQLEAKLGQAPVIVDVREPAEFQQGHVFGAVNIPRGVLEFEVAAHSDVASRVAPELTVQDANLVLYCRTGGRSALAADSLQQMGFSNVESLEGGFLGWEAAGKPIRQT
ncbi:MAG: rhodanese-like domain-containing protein [Xanthomonadales bacterium]|nr:rhodanese-like domain-containing protein [Xanthomonadales bacterium]